MKGDVFFLPYPFCSCRAQTATAVTVEEFLAALESRSDPRAEVVVVSQAFKNVSSRAYTGLVYREAEWRIVCWFIRCLRPLTKGQGLDTNTLLVNSSGRSITDFSRQVATLTWTLGLHITQTRYDS